MPNLVNESSFRYDNLFAGNVQPQVVGPETIAKGQKLKRGALLGITDNGNELKLVSKKATDGTNEPYAVLPDDIDTTDGAQITSVYYTGEFNIAAISVSEGELVSDYKKSARILNIFFKTVIKA